jgi:hypothetical protein
MISRWQKIPAPAANLKWQADEGTGGYSRSSNSGKEPASDQLSWNTADEVENWALLIPDIEERLLAS